MKWTKEKIQAFFGIEADVEHDNFSKEIKISISPFAFCIDYSNHGVLGL